MGGPSTIDGETHPETDNFLPCNFTIDGITYLSAENYFQCAKATNDADRDLVLKSGPGLEAWEAGQQIQVRSDWQKVKVDEMYKGNVAKFQQNQDLRNALLSSGTAPIIFSASEDFWDKWNGLIMERIRAELRQNGEEDARRAEEIREAMDEFAEKTK